VSRKCPATLMEKDWEEGFTCTLPEDHDGPHRDDACEVNVSTDDVGRRYMWTYEWSFVPVQPEWQ
jgi:hypothetical protein